jgi:hypothetical protein
MAGLNLPVHVALSGPRHRMTGTSQRLALNDLGVIPTDRLPPRRTSTRLVNPVCLPQRSKLKCKWDRRKMQEPKASVV